MKVLITSGGTKVYIDPIRSISNMATGKFGSKLAKEVLFKDHNVIYLTSKEGKSPFCSTIDRLKLTDSESIQKINDQNNFTKKYVKEYIEHRYDSYYEYSTILKESITKYNPDIIILTAAVSDYTVTNFSNNKIKSTNSCTIKLNKAPKVINDIKQMHPNVFLVGFKLLIDSSEKDLVDAAKNIMRSSKADIIVANNLSSLKKGKHEIILLEKNGFYEKITNNLPFMVINKIFKRFDI
ncbi:hypothetical protein N9L02_01260 [Gammaproteobacteria bacterium]|nr:hypothetical protein [Gammaproteobacteria bacterium]